MPEKEIKKQDRKKFEKRIERETKKEQKNASLLILIQSWNRRREQEWQIDIETFTFRNEKVKVNKDGRIVTENGIDIFSEYYKTVENAFYNSNTDKLTRVMDKHVRRMTL